MSDPRYRVLGPVVLVSDAGVPTPITSHRQRTLLASLLAAHGRTMSKSQLTGVVWGLDSPVNSDAAIHTLVSRLRQSLPTGALVTRARGYALLVGPDELDSTRFTDLVDRARTTRETDPSHAVALLRDALALWRGPAYEEFSDHQHFLHEIERLSELELSAKETIFEIMGEVGQAAEAVPALERHVREHPLRDTAVGCLMRYLYEMGRQNDALATYARHRAALVQEMGIEPSQRLKKLEADILTQRLCQVHSARPHVVAGASRPSGSGFVGRFVGREHDLARLGQLMSQSRLVTVLGPGGVGKSRLVSEYLRTSAASPDGLVHVVDVGKAGQPGAVMAAVADALGHTSWHTGEHVAPGTTVVLDNCEHVVDEVRQAVTDLTNNAGARVVATSRTRLGLPAEHVLDLGPLPLPPREGVEAAMTSPAVALLVDRMSAVRNITLTEDNVADIVALCRKADGLPLALEIIAPHVRGMSVADLAETVTHRYSLSSIVDWSYRLLDDELAAVFRHLAVFTGEFTVPAMRAVCRLEDRTDAEVERIALSLIDNSVVRVVDRHGVTCYQMLEVLRQRAAELLEESGETAAAAERHASFYASFAGALLDVAPTLRQSALATALIAFDNLCTAVEWCLAHDNSPDRAFALSAAIWCAHLARVRDARDRSDRAHHALARTVVGIADRTLQRWQSHTHPLVSYVASTAAAAHFVLGDFDSARDRALEAVAAERNPGVRRSVQARRTLAWIEHLVRGNQQAAIDWAREARTLADAASDTRAVCELDLLIAAIVAARGDHDAAVRMTETVCHQATGIGHEHVVVWSRVQLGTLYLTSSVARSEAILELALADARRLRYTYAVGAAVRALAMASAVTGDLGESAALFEAALAHYKSEGERLQLWQTLATVVPLLVRADDLRTAATVVGAIEQTAIPISAVAGSPVVSDSIGTLGSILPAHEFDALRARGALLDVSEVVRVVDTSLAVIVGAVAPSRRYSGGPLFESDPPTEPRWSGDAGEAANGSTSLSA